ncbi:MAG: hypothetical protein KAR21_00040 [Spirochaetales bacterium]|nr:hypothetical protein [Spirochaetales bacterium]
MLNRQEKILISILVIVLVILIVLFLFIINDRNSIAEERIERYTAQIESLQNSFSKETNLAEIKTMYNEAIESERIKYYLPDQMDIYRFGRIIQNLLLSLDLEIKRYQTVEDRDVTLLEFSISGSSLSFITFIQEVYKGEKHWGIPYLVIKTRGGSGDVEVVFRIGYEQNS